jgi:endonuclease/exonuclease/phosphatase family metal-dependent hydrolase
VLVDGLARLQPDLVAFQEAITSDGYDQVVDVLGPDFHVVHQRTGLLGDGNHGASIASRWPLVDVREVDLHVTPRTADYPCGTLVAEIRAPEPFGPLLFVDHGPSYQWGAEHERELQAVAAARLVEEVVDGREIHVVLAGDFNAVPDAASVRFWCGLQALSDTSVSYEDAWETASAGDPGHTHSPGNPLVHESGTPLEPGRRIDYIFVRCADHGPTLAVSACALAFDRPVGGVWASDHFGVVADLAVPSHSAAA